MKKVKSLNSIPIFDSLIHCESESLFDINNQMKDNNIIYSCSTDFIDPEFISYSEYFNKFSEYSNIIPIAYVNTQSDNIDKILPEIKNIGYIGIKIHLRKSNDKLTNINIDKIFKKCAELNLIIFFCTYFYNDSDDIVDNNFENVAKLVNRNLNTKIVLLHGGSVELLKFMELVRFNKNLLLDLSFTMCKYEGSSIDLDIQFLFKKFDRRICVGSDLPDFRFSELRDRFNFFIKNIDIEKAENIGYRNLKFFLGISNDN